MTIAIEGPGDDDALIALSKAAFDEIQRIEALMSFHDPQSELSLLNRDAVRKPVAVSADMIRVLRFALELSEATNGAFDLNIAAPLVGRGDLPDHGGVPKPEGSWRDIRLEGDLVRFARPLLLDLGGIAKGYAVDCAFSKIPVSFDVVVDAGGDMRMRPWRGRSLHVRAPGQYETGAFVEAAMEAEAVATSSGYFSDGQHPIVNPVSGSSIVDQRSVSVFAPQCMIADALTKAVFLCSDSDSLLERWSATALVVEPDAAGGGC